MKKIITILALFLAVTITAKEPTRCTAIKADSTQCKSTMTLKDGNCRVHSSTSIRCGAKTSKGTPCKMIVSTEGEKCRHHKL